MIVFFLKRLFNAAVVMLAVAAMAFLIFRFVGDPVEMMVNEQATQAERDELRERLGLNQSVLTQFGRFVVSAAQGDFGISYRNQREVSSLIAERFPATFELVLIATILSLVIGIPLGVLTAIHRGRWYSEALQLVSIIGVSLPSFVVGILLILVFSVTLGWAPGFGRGDVVDLGWWSTGLLTHSGRAALILPSFALALFQITLVMRLVRAEMLETMRMDFIKFARARGVPARTVQFRHALRNCLMPVITMTGMQIGNLIAFALITETVFQWPGMGLLFIQAVTFVDIPVMAAYLCIVSFIFVAINTLVDITYAAIDPRLRLQGH
jgi:peptide/nickel transport system permease protein